MTVNKKRRIRVLSITEVSLGATSIPVAGVAGDDLGAGNDTINNSGTGTGIDVYCSTRDVVAIVAIIARVSGEVRVNFRPVGICDCQTV